MQEKNGIKNLCPNCKNKGKKIELSFVPLRMDCPAHFFCSVCKIEYSRGEWREQKKEEEQMREEKIFCPRCEEVGEKREMLFLPGREDRPAQYWCYVCNYPGKKEETDWS